MDENTNTPNEEVKVETPEYTEIELRALDMGWKPRSDFHGDDVDFIDAKEFVNRKPLYDRIESQSRQLKNVSKALDALKQHYGRVQETEYNRALQALKQQRKEALSNGDGDQFEAIDTQIKQVERQFDVLQQSNATPAVVDDTLPQVFNEWKSKNSWYDTTTSMRAYADEIGKELAAKGVDPVEVLRQVEQEVRKEFPHKFKNPNKDNAPDVGTSRVPAGRSRADSFEMTEQERQIMNTLIRSDPTRFTKEKYIADLKKIKGLE